MDRTLGGSNAEVRSYPERIPVSTPFPCSPDHKRGQDHTLSAGSHGIDR